jgi:SAM-dependent methyltransferase
MSLLDKASNPLQYDSVGLDWEQEGMLDSPTRVFFREYLEQSLENLDGKSVIDIGSGTGHLTKLLLERGARTIYGIEPSRKNVEISKKLYPKMKVINTSLENAKLSKTFDVAVMVMTFEHIRNIDSAFHKIASLLKPHGTFYVIVGDKRYFTTKRFGYVLDMEDIGNDEVVVGAKRSYGTIYDIFRPVSSYTKSAQKAGLVLINKVPLTPTDRFLHMDPKYMEFVGKPISNLLIFQRSD